MGALLSVTQDSAFRAIKRCVISSKVGKRLYAPRRIDMASD